MSVSRRRERDFREKRANFARLSEKICGDKAQSGPRRTPPKGRFVNTLQHFWPVSVFGRFSVFYAIFESTHGAQTRAPSAGHPPPPGGRPGAGSAGICCGFNDFMKTDRRKSMSKSRKNGSPKVDFVRAGCSGLAVTRMPCGDMFFDFGRFA